MRFSDLKYARLFYNGTFANRAILLLNYKVRTAYASISYCRVQRNALMERPLPSLILFIHKIYLAYNILPFPLCY